MQNWYYYPNGTLAGYNLPSIKFPLSELLGGTNGLNVFISNPFSEFDFEINLTAKQYADKINDASTALIKLGSKEIPGFFGIKPSTTSTILTTEFYKDITTLTMSNLNWVKNNENNITKYLDIKVQTVTLTADIAAPGKPFFSNPQVPFQLLIQIVIRQA